MEKIPVVVGGVSSEYTRGQLISLIEGMPRPKVKHHGNDIAHIKDGDGVCHYLADWATLEQEIVWASILLMKCK